jgi:3-hydroxyacyl-CoA dehydrogenase
MTNQKILVVGAGTMGRGIAQVAAAKYLVHRNDVTRSLLDDASPLPSTCI